MKDRYSFSYDQSPLDLFFSDRRGGSKRERERERERELAGGGEGSRFSILFLFAVLYSCLLLGNFLVETVCLMLVKVEMLDFVLIVSFRHVWRIRIYKIAVKF
jgi:hypothetical protein